MADDELEADYELLAAMTWDDNGYESKIEKDAPREQAPSPLGQLDGEELQVLDQLVQDIKELTPVEGSCESSHLPTEVSLVSTSKDAKIEISWEMFKNWDQGCGECQAES
jgi:hypothetical protein